MTKKIHLLLIEDARLDALVIEKLMSKSERVKFTFEHADRLETALKVLAEKESQFDLILSDLGLPDSFGMETLTRLTTRVSELPIIVLTGNEDDDLAYEALQIGAQDYLVKGTFNPMMLERAVLYSMERHRIIKNLELEIRSRREAERSLFEAHRQMEQVFDGMADGVCVIDSDLKITHINNRIPFKLPFPRGQMAGMACYDLFRLPICQTDQCVWQRIKAGAQKTEDDIVKEGPNGIHAVILAARPLRDSSDQPIAVIENYKDITERKRLEHQLVHAQKLESIGQLAAGIAHEINTPTQYISDNTVFLQRAFKGLMVALQQSRTLVAEAESGQVDPALLQQTRQVFKKAKIDYIAKQVPRALEQSLEGLDRVASIVGAMKDFSHPSSVEKKPVDIHRAIESTLTVSRNEWKYVACVQTDFDTRVPPVPCLRDEFCQVILNMTVNAAHAIAEKGEEEKGTIKISTRLDGDWVEIKVSDTGAGIPTGNCDRIFDPFFTTKEVGRGTGQGLAIAHAAIVDKHAGDITVESEEGVGTVFTIRLPLVEPGPGDVA
jgi:signal transduction histidine kinase/DNA-binding NarL/FixJ family response regulator